MPPLTGTLAALGQATIDAVATAGDLWRLALAAGQRFVREPVRGRVRLGF